MSPTRHMHVKNIDIYVYWASRPHTRHMDVNPVPMHVARMHAERSLASDPDQVLPRRPCLRLAPETAALVLLPSQHLGMPGALPSGLPPGSLPGTLPRGALPPQQLADAQPGVAAGSSGRLHAAAGAHDQLLRQQAREQRDYRSVPIVRPRT